MTTAQLTGYLKIGHHRRATAVRKTRIRHISAGELADAMLLRALKKVEMEDTFAGKAASYGLCGIVFLYLTAQIARVLIF